MKMPPPFCSPWTTKYRLPLIQPQDDHRLHQLLDDAAASAQSELIAAGNGSDHVHALVRVSAKVTIAAVAQRLKGRSSYFGGWRWQRGYFAECIAACDVPDKVSYVRNQRWHHPQSAEGGLESAANGLVPLTSVGGDKKL